MEAMPSPSTAGDGIYCATDGLSAHEKVHLADGLVDERSHRNCPERNGRGSIIRSARPRYLHLLHDLRAYAVREWERQGLRGSSVGMAAMVIIGAGMADMAR